MSNNNPLLYGTLILPIDGTAAQPKIQIGGSSASNSGTGIYGDAATIKFSVAGTDIAQITSSGITNLVGGVSVLTSAASVGGAASEVFTVTGLLSTDTILSVSQKVKGANSLPLLGFNTQATNALTGVYSADPGANAIIIVAIKR